jgi:putative membrane protein
MIKNQKLFAIGSFLVLAVPTYAQTAAPSTGPKSQAERGQAGSSSTDPGSTMGTSQTPSSQTGGSASSGMGQTDTSSRGTSAAAGKGQGEGDDATRLLGFIHHANQGEIEMAKLAKDNSKSDQVQKFAERIIKDHEKADEDVKSFAKTHNIDLKSMEGMKDSAGKKVEDSEAAGSPGSMAGKPAMGDMKEHAGMHGGMREHKATLDKLRGLKGAEFDREFANAMVQDHQKAIDKLTNARTRISGNAELTAFIDKLLPVLKQHLAMAEKLQSGSKA